MKQYTRKQLKEYVRLGLARDLTEVDPDTCLLYTSDAADE